ncbi:restriction endonuclease subunit S [Vaginella massiliensis]|uniref:restriction endonuclease subunit S n=1 Tax=Vaginella massiliensis TaxID=1816680 RepID=UPI0008391673|nr:restriction endonuclease subunit S [Vaginella massiliensis]
MALGLTPKQIIDKGTHPLLVKKDTWLRVELGDICNIQNGYAFSSKYFNHEKGLPLIRIRDIFQKATENLYSGEYSEDFLVRRNDFLIGMDGDFKISKWPGELGLLNQRVCRIILQSNLMSKEYVFLCIQPYLDAIHSETSAVTVKHLSSKTISEIPIPLPPLPEQRAIVKKIEALFSSLDAGIADLKKAQDQLKIYRQAVLKKAFEGELTKEWREKQTDLPTAEELKQALKLIIDEALKNKNITKGNYFPDYANGSSGFNIPNKWNFFALKAIVQPNKTSLKRGPFGSALKKEFFIEKGVPVYEQGHAINDEPFRHRYFISDEKYEELKGFTAGPNDLIISCSGATLGRICHLPQNADIGIINQALLKISLNERIILHKYFIIMFRSEIFQRLIFEKSLGTAMPNMVGMNELKDIAIPIPSIQEQAQIVKEIESRLSVCDAVEQQIKDSLSQAEALRQSILKKAFEGKLLSEEELTLCKQAPDYEPASVLLEKIKAEKEANKPVKKKTMKMK